MQHIFYLAARLPHPLFIKCNTYLTRIFVVIPARLPHPPIIQRAPKNQTVVVGGMARFECHIISDAQPHLQWLKHYLVNGSYLDDKGVPYVEIVKVRQGHVLREFVVNIIGSAGGVNNG